MQVALVVPEHQIQPALGAGIQQQLARPRPLQQDPCLPVAAAGADPQPLLAGRDHTAAAIAAAQACGLPGASSRCRGVRRGMTSRGVGKGSKTLTRTDQTASKASTPGRVRKSMGARTVEPGVPGRLVSCCTA